MQTRQRERAQQQSDLSDDIAQQQQQSRVLVMSSPQGSPTKRKATSTLKLRVPQKKLHLDLSKPSSTRTRSIYDMNIVEINDFLKARLQGQDESLDRLTDVLYRFNQRPVPSDADQQQPPLILPLMLSGVSGTGKTATAKLLRQLYQVGPAQYIRYDLTRITDETQVNILLGSGPGLVGSTGRSNLPMELLRAVGRVPTGKMDVDLTEEQYQLQRRQQQHDNEPPRTVLLHFDEADKAYAQFMTLMLNFIEDGELTASSDVKFVLPRETRL
jgi:ATP-dependent Clp protease ATP-binding subunit ClpA